MTHLHIDFETRSEAELTEVGTDNYARHPSTDVWCMAYCMDDGPTYLTADDMFLPSLARDHVRKGNLVVAHNAAFELAIWNNVCVPRYGWPPLKPEQMRDTMVMAYALGLPGSLENAAAATGIAQQKDLAGQRLMLQMCKPKPGGGWWDEPEKKEKLFDYCRQDVEVERALDKRILPLSPAEQALWVLDRRINERGIAIGRQAIERAVAVVLVEQDRLNAELRAITGNFVGFVTEVARLTKWIQQQGVAIDGLAKADVLDALALDDLPDNVRRALEIRQEAGKSSTAKLNAMLKGASPDGRIRNTKQYHGANTGRWAGRRVQPDNFPRPTLLKTEEDVEEAFAALRRLPPERFAAWARMFHGSAMHVLADMLRGMIVAAKGHDLIAADFANIEGRVLAWLAGEKWKLKAFADYDAGKGPDLYLVSAGRIYGCEPAEAKPHRQIGKVAELALGYQGGVGAFQQMAKTYGVKLSDERAGEIKDAWRYYHPEILAYWYAVEAAAIGAVRNPGAQIEVGAKGAAVKFRVSGSFLFCKLPSGRCIAYPYPQIREIETPWGECKDALTYKTVLDSTARKKAKIVDDPTNKGSWWRIATYGGSLVENITQAVARDILAESLFRLEARGYPVVMHVHDEAVAEVPHDFGSVEEMSAIMAEVPAWAKGLPVAVEGWRGGRYRK